MADVQIEAVRMALGLTKETISKHARNNLDGALHDIEHMDGRADEISIRTIRRVIGQLYDAEKALQQ